MVRRALKRTIKLLGAALLGLIFILALIIVSPGVIAPVVQPIRMYLLDAALAAVSRQLNGTITVGALEGSLLSDPTLRDTRIADVRGETILHASTVALRYDPLSLWHGQLRMEALDIGGVVLELVETKDGSLNLVEVFARGTPAPEEAEEGGASVFPLALERATLRNGRVDLALSALPGVETVESVHATLSAELGAQGLSARIHELRAGAQPADVTLRTVEGAFAYKADQITLEGWLLETGSTRISVDGPLPEATSPGNLRLELQPFDLAEIGRILGEESLQGGIEGVVEVSGPLSDLNLSAALDTSRGLATLGAQIDAAAAVPRYRGSAELKGFDLTSLVAREELASDLNARLGVEGEGVTLGDLAAELELVIDPSRFGVILVEPSQVRLAVNSKRIEVQAFELDASVLEASVSGHVDLAGESALAYRVAAELADLETLIGVEELAGEMRLRGSASGVWPDLVAEGVLEGEGIAYEGYTLETLDASYRAASLGAAPEATVTVAANSARIGDASVDSARLAADYVRADEEHHLEFDLELAQSQALAGMLAGELTADQDGAELTLDRVRVRAGDRTWGNAVPLQVSASPDFVELAPFRLEHDEEAIELSGGFGGGNFQDLVLRANALDLGFVRDTFELPAMIAGRLDLALELSGSLDEPVVDGVLGLESVQAGDLPFQRSNLQLAYRDAKLTGEASMLQAEREALRLSLAVPIDLALGAVALEDRLQAGALALNLDVEALDIGALTGELAGGPLLEGTVSGGFQADGSFAGLDLSAEFDLIDLSLPGVVENLRLPIGIEAEVLAAPSLEALRAALRENTLSVALTEFTLESDSVTGFLPGDGEPRSLTVKNIRALGSGGWDETGIAATVREAGLQVALTGLPAADVSLAAELTPERVSLERLDLETEASALAAEGVYGLADGGLEFRLAVPSLELREFVAGLPPQLPSKISGELNAAGTREAPSLEAMLRYAESDVEANLTSTLAEQPPGYAGRIRVSSLDLARFVENVQGRLNTTLEFEGVGFEEADRDVALKLELESTDLSLAPGLEGRLDAAVRGGSIELRQLDLDSAAVALEAEGMLSPQGVEGLDYSLKVLDLAHLESFLGTPLDARGELSGNLQGPFDALETRSRLGIREWYYGAWQGGQLSAQIRAGGLPAAPSGSAKIEVADLAGPGLTASTLALDAEIAQAAADFTLAAVSGPFENSRISGETRLVEGVDTTLDLIRLQRDDWIWQNAGPVRARVSPSGNVSIENVELRNGSQSVTAAASLEADGRLRAEARIRGLQLGPAVSAFAEPALPLSGMLAADLEAGGTLARPQLEGDLEASALEWGEQNLGRVDAKLATRGGVIDGNVSWLYEQQEVLTADGRWDLARPEALDLRVQAEAFDLGRLQPLTREIIASSGRVDLDLALKGSLNRPRAEGRLGVRDGELQLAILGERFTDLQSEITFNGRRVDVRQLEVGSRTGSARLSGWIEIDDFTSFRTDLAFSSENFTVINTPGLGAEVTSDIEIKGSDADLNVSGTIVVPSSRVRYAALPAAGAASVEPWELTVEGVFGAGKEAALAKLETPAERSRRAAPNLDFLRAGLAIDIPRNSWVRGTGTAVELSGDLEVTKRLREPFIISGSIETVRGFANILGRRFQIESGTVTFRGIKDINPFLDIVAFHQNRGYIIYVQISGESRKPKLEFSSIPELAEADIISLLLFGRTQDKLTNSEQNDLAGNVAGGVAAGVLENSLADGLGLDSVAIDFGDEQSGGSVGVGRYLTNDVFVSYERTFRDPQKANRGGNTVFIEYSLKPRLKLRGTGSDFGETAVDIFWQVDY